MIYTTHRPWIYVSDPLFRPDTGTRDSPPSVGLRRRRGRTRATPTMTRRGDARVTMQMFVVRNNFIMLRRRPQ